MGRKIRTSIALDEDLINWIKEMIKLKRFANTSHAISYAVQRLKEQGKQELHLTTIIDEGSEQVCTKPPQYKQ